jgi:hypothetical protein
MDKESLIERYLQSSLSAEDQLLFEQLLAEDEDFRKELAFQQHLKAAIALEERKKIKSMLEATKKQGQRRVIWWSAAASLLVAVGVYLMLSISSPPSGEKLYLAYYQTHPNVVAPSVRGTSDIDIEANPFLAFDNGNYAEAAQLFAVQFEASGTNSAAFYQGISLMEIGEMEAALEAFKLVNAGDDFGIYKLWYSALANVKLGKYSEAKLLLEAFSREETPLQEKANVLLKKLK